MQEFAFDNLYFPDEWAEREVALDSMPSVVAPTGTVDRIEDGNVLAQYRAGKDMACADIVICTRLPSGEPAVMLSLRKPTEPFGGKWWVYGGSVGAYTDILEFVAKRAERECGVKAPPQALIGFYRTCAEDSPQSTIQPCFVTAVEYEFLERKMATDPNHQSVRLFTLEELGAIPAEQKHWYPVRVSRAALENMPR